MMERLLRDIYDAISSLRQRISYLETQDGVADLSDAMSFVQLTDAPDNYIGQAGKVVAVTAGEDGLEFVAGGGALADHDHSGDPGDGGTFDAANLTSGTAADGYVLTADGSGGAAWEAVSGGASELNDLTDVDLTTPPSDGQALVFDSGSGTWKAETLAGGVTDFLDLSDTPVAYPATRQLLSPNDSGDGLEFVEKTVISEGFLEIASDPAKFGTKVNLESYTSSTTEATRLSLLRGRGTQASPSNLQDEDRLGNIDFRNAYTNGIAATISSSVDGTPTGSVTPGSLYISLYNPDGTLLTPFTIRSSGLVGINESNPEGQLHVGGEVALEDITTPDTPPAGIHKIYSKSDGIYVLDSSGSEIGPIGGGANELDDLTDVDLTTPPSDGQALVFDSGSSTWKAETLAGGVTDFLDLTDTPAAYTGKAGFFVSPNAGETALEFTRILQPTEEDTDDYSLIIRDESGDKDVIFHATPGTQDANLVLKRAGGSVNFGPGLSFHQLSGTFDSPSAVGPTQTLGRLEWWGQATSTTHTRAAYIEVARDGAGTGTFAMPGKLAIYVQPQNQSDLPINALQILSSGNVGFGTTSPTEKVHINGIIALTDQTTPSTPAAGIHKIYSKSDGIYVLNSAGTEIGPLGTGGRDENAIHDDESGEIAALDEKSSPVSTDLLLIEDSEAGNTKKKVQIGNLPVGGAASFSGAQVSRSDQPVAPVSTYTIPWNLVHFDTDNYWDAQEPTRLTAPFTGYYQISMRVDLQDGADADGYMVASVNRTMANFAQFVGISDSQMSYSGDSTGPSLQSTGVWRLEAGDYIELTVTHYNASGNKLVVCGLTMVFMGA